MRQPSSFILSTVFFLTFSGCSGLIAGSNLNPAVDLLPGEIIILSKKANLWVKPSEYGLRSLFSGLHGVLDMEAIGGQVHLTNYRLVFKSHAYNRIVGKVSVFLPPIATIRDTLGGMVREVTVTTSLTEFEYVIWGIPAFIESVKQAKAALGQDDISKIQALAVQYYDRVGEGLQTFGGMAALNSVFIQKTKSVRDLLGLARNPYEAIGVIALQVLLEQ